MRGGIGQQRGQVATFIKATPDASVCLKDNGHGVQRKDCVEDLTRQTSVKVVGIKITSWRHSYYVFTLHPLQPLLQ